MWDCCRARSWTGRFLWVLSSPGHPVILWPCCPSQVSPCWGVRPSPVNVCCWVLEGPKSIPDHWVSSRIYFPAVQDSALPWHTWFTIQARGFRDAGSFLSSLCQSKCALEGESEFFRSSFKEAPQGCWICVRVRELSLQRITPEEEKAGWSWQEMRTVERCEEAKAVLVQYWYRWQGSTLEIKAGLRLTAVGRRK